MPPEGLSNEERMKRINEEPLYAELIRYLNFQKQQLGEIKNQGDVFFHNRYYEEAIQYFDEYKKGPNMNDLEIYRKKGLSRLSTIGYD